MLATLSFHRGNVEQAVLLCEKIKQLGGCQRHAMLLATDEKGLVEDVAAIVEGEFSEVSTFVAHEHPSGWPARENALISNLARRIYYKERTPWLRMEPDSVPLKVGWLDEIEEEYKAKGRPILCGITPHPKRVCGVSVFAPDMSQYSTHFMMPSGMPWYGASFLQLQRFIASTELIAEEPTEKTVIHVRSSEVPVLGSINRHCIVQLGKIGDILNILPLVRHIYVTEGQKPILMVHKDYGEIVSDLDYCEAEEWSRGAWSDLSMAVSDARKKYRRVTISQIHGDRWQLERKCTSFCIESYRMAKHEEDWGKHPLELTRDAIREEKLVSDCKIDPNRKLVLINSNGVSSPFQHGKELLALPDVTKFQVIDLSQVRATRFVDLLGLYDIAHTVVTTDTATLHLAEASHVPVVALVTDKPTSWHASPQKGNIVLTVPYHEFEKRRTEIKDAIERPHVNVIHHVFQDYNGSGETERRSLFARSTWMPPRQVTVIPHPVLHFLRDSRDIGDTRALPYIKDIIDAPMDEMLDHEFLLLTNTDTCLRKGLYWQLALLKGEAYHAHRRDCPKLERQLDQKEFLQHKWYPGSDLFLFRKRWWLKHRDEFPDLILGAEVWDKILRYLINDTGGEEIHSAIYHEKHQSTWELPQNRRTDPSNRYCRILAKEWLQKRGHPLQELAQFNDLPVTGLPSYRQAIERKEHQNGSHPDIVHPPNVVPDPFAAEEIETPQISKDEAEALAEKEREAGREFIRRRRMRRRHIAKSH